MCCLSDNLNLILGLGLGLALPLLLLLVIFAACVFVRNKQRKNDGFNKDKGYKSFYSYCISNTYYITK